MRTKCKFCKFSLWPKRRPSGIKKLCVNGIYLLTVHFPLIVFIFSESCVLCLLCTFHSYRRIRLSVPTTLILLQCHQYIFTSHIEW